MAKRPVLIVAVLAVVACAGHGGASSASRSTSSPSHACPADRLSSSFRAEDGSAGHYHAVLMLVNTGRTACRLSPTATVQMLAGRGSPLSTRTAVDRSRGRPTPVLLAPGARGSIQWSWVEISSGEPCATPGSLEVVVPNDPHALVVPWPADHDLVCGHGVVTIQPAQLGVPRV